MILKGKKTILRPIRLSDAQRFVDWFADPETNRFTTRQSITLKQEIKQIKEARQNKDELQFSIDTKDGKHIGSLSFFPIKKDRGGSFGIFIGDKDYWDKGYGSDAIKTILKYGFEKLHLHHIRLAGNGVFDYNLRAIRAYEKLGFVKEGLLRERFFYDGKYRNIIPMSILESEWKKKK